MIEPLEGRSSWPKVPIASDVGAPRPVGRQRKTRIKGCLEGGSGMKPVDKDAEKARKMIHGKYKCPNCGALGHRKNNPKCPLNGSKKKASRNRPKLSIIFISLTQFSLLCFCAGRGSQDQIAQKDGSQKNHLFHRLKLKMVVLLHLWMKTVVLPHIQECKIKQS
jgi:hypothetical protein